MDSFEESPEALLTQRVSGFEAFRSERMPVLHEFCKNLGFDEPHEVLIYPEKFLPLLDSGFRHSVISDENRVWFITRIGYFIGEYLIGRYQGCWLVDKEPESPTFTRYVVGDFSFGEEIDALIDPFAIAQGYADTPVPRGLGQAIEKGLVKE